MQLNELEEGMKGVLPPTDCRLRPDIRHMEKGDMGMVIKLYRALYDKSIVSTSGVQ